MTRRFALVFLCLLCWHAGAHGYNGRLAIVLNKANPTAKVTVAELRRIFTKEDRVWRNGEAMVPVDWEAASDVRKQFSRKVLGKSVLEMREYWVQQTMTKGLTAPSTFKSTPAILRFVSSVPGAISYIPEAEVDETVKLVFVLD